MRGRVAQDTARVRRLTVPHRDTGPDCAAAAHCVLKRRDSVTSFFARARAARAAMLAQSMRRQTIAHFTRSTFVAPVDDESGPAGLL